MGSPISKSYKELENTLKDIGNDFYTDDSKDSDQNFWDSYKNTQNLIIEADVVIADETAIEDDSISALSIALDYKKPCLIILNRNSGNIHRLLTVKHKNLSIKTYSDQKDLREMLVEFIGQVKDTLDAKLFMIIPPSVNKYLDWVVANTNKSKSDVVRSAVDGVAEKDKDYQSFLKSIK
jgi:hypothetical protein